MRKYEAPYYWIYIFLVDKFHKAWKIVDETVYNSTNTGLLFSNIPKF